MIFIKNKRPWFRTHFLFVLLLLPSPLHCLLVLRHPVGATLREVPVSRKTNLGRERCLRETDVLV